MPEASLITRNPSAPADYDQLFRKQFPRLVHHLRRQGWDHPTAEDMAMAVIIRILETRGLEAFDVTRATIRDGVAVPMPFSRYFGAFAYWQLRGLMTTEQLRAHRFPLVPDLDEHLLGLVPDPAEVVTDQMERTDMLAHLIGLLRRRGRRRGHYDPVLVLKQMLVQVHEQGWVDPEVLGRHFRVPTHTARRWVRQIHSDLAQTAETDPMVDEEQDLFNPDGSGRIVTTGRRPGIGLFN